MDRLFSPIAKPLDQINYVAVGLNPKGAHVGLFYRLKQDAPVHFIDLAWHYVMRNVPATDCTGYYWVDLGVPALRAEQVAQLEVAGVPIINPNGWQPRPDDLLFFNMVIEWLTKGVGDFPPANPEHVELVKQQVAAGAVRFKPVEIAGAATSAARPVVFNDAVALGKAVQVELGIQEHPPQAEGNPSAA